jgi:hypothetical protein
MASLEQQFKAKYRRLSEDKKDEYDEIFFTRIEPAIEEMYGGYHPKGLKAEQKKQRFDNYFYMYFLVHPEKTELDEREDQPLFYEAERYAEQIPIKKKV